MYFAAHSKLSDEATKSLSPYLSNDAIVVGASRGKEFNWISRLAAVTRSGCARLEIVRRVGSHSPNTGARFLLGTVHPTKLCFRCFPEWSDKVGRG